VAEVEPDFRGHLGASVIGRPCERSLWYGFRWATARRHPARILRLFARGQREEAVLVDLLRKAGVEVWEADEEGQQFRVSAVGGHFGGSLDGVGLGLVEAPEKPHVLEFKTHGDKSFKDLSKHGLEKSKPEHHAQITVYMHLMDIDRGLYLAVNKNDDTLHAERVRHSAKAANTLLDKAHRIITSYYPPAKISDDAAFYLCKWCDHAQVCHGNTVPPPTCRSCVHATPELDGDARWSCARFGCDLDVDTQRRGSECPAHVFIPALLPWKAVDASEAEGWIEYRLPDGRTLRNGPGGFASRELSANVALCVDPVVAGAKEMLGAEVIA
jgi:hypothetical protein